MIPKKSRHNQLKNDLIDFLRDTGFDKDWTFFNRIVGKVYYKVGKKFIGPYNAGVMGQCDIYLYGKGKSIEIELKGVGDKMSKSQKNWEKFCKENEIEHIIVWEKYGVRKFDKLLKILRRVTP